MDNIESLLAKANELPESVRQNGLDLLDRMSQKIEGIGDEEVEFRAPFLKIVQATSDRSTLPKGSGIGSLILGEDVMPNPMAIIPLRIWDGRQYWSPDKDENRMICRSADGKFGSVFGECKTCTYGKYNEVEKKSQCGKTKTLVAVTEDLSKIFQVTFTKSNYSVGLDLAALMKKAGVAIYRRSYNLGSATGVKYKNVESYTVAPKSSVEADCLPFLTELFNRVSYDRKTFLDTMEKFRANHKALPAPEQDSGEGVLLLEGESSEDQSSGENTPRYQI